MTLDNTTRVVSNYFTASITTLPTEKAKVMRNQFPSILEDVLSRGFDKSRRIGRDDTGRFCKGVHVRCSQCDAVVINGVAAHERTCPNEPGEDAHWHEDGDDILRRDYTPDA